MSNHDDFDDPPPESYGPPPERPKVTVGLLVVIAAVFALELALPDPAARGDRWSVQVPTLLAMGGIHRSLVLEGQWWRLVCGPFLHGGFLHLLMNSISLWMVGTLLEPFVGRWWYAGLYVLGALGGSALSVAINGDNIVSVGASGAIMGLFAAAMSVSFTLPPSPTRSAVQGSLARVLILSLLPLAPVGGARIDYAAHFGGAVAGGLAGLGLWLTWDRRTQRPRGVFVARALAVLGVLLTLWAGGNVVTLRRGAEGMIPASELPDGARYTDLLDRADELATRYPRDPRARFLRSMVRSANGNRAGAEADLRAGLADPGLLRRQFPDRRVEVALRTSLAQLLMDSNREAEARTVVQPVCSVRIDGRPAAAVTVLGLCP